METGKSHNVLSASWRSKKANRVIQAECEVLETRCGDGINSSQGQGKINIPARADRPETKRSAYLLFLPFLSYLVLNRLDSAHPHWGREI